MEKDLLKDKELEQVAAGGYTGLQSDVMYCLNKAGVAVTQANSAFSAMNDLQSARVCSRAQSALLEAVHMVDGGTVPWDIIRRSVNEVLSILDGMSGEQIADARQKLQECLDIMPLY